MRAAVVVGAALLCAALGLGLFSSAGRDDSHITYWPAWTLLEHGELWNYNGERVEQSSSLLHVLVLAAAGAALPVDLPTLGGGVSLLFGALGVLAAAALGRALHPAGAVPAALLAATAPYFVYWSASGMETSLVATAALVCALATARALDPARSAPLGLAGAVAAAAAFTLARPEGWIVLACVATGALAFLSLRLLRPSGAADERDLRVMRARCALLLAAILALAAAFAGLRALYFGSALPQPVVAKSGDWSPAVAWRGLGYLLRRLVLPWLALPVTLAVAVALWRAVSRLVRADRTEPPLLVTTLFVGAYLAFVLFAGGDWMEGGRFVAHVWPMALALLAWAVLSAERGPRFRRRVLAGLVALQLLFALDFARRESTGVPLWLAGRFDGGLPGGFDEARFSWFERNNRIHRREIPAIQHLDAVVRALREAGREPVLLSRQMGMVMYHVARRNFGGFHVHDRRGLVERSFPACPLSDDLPRLQVGLDLRYRFFFEHEAAFAACGIPRPDVIFDIGLDDEGGSPDDLVPYGYEIVYRQDGALVNGSRWLPGASVPAEEFVAVRSNLVSLLPQEGDTRVDYSTGR